MKFFIIFGKSLRIVFPNAVFHVFFTGGQLIKFRVGHIAGGQIARQPLQPTAHHDFLFNFPGIMIRHNSAFHSFIDYARKALAQNRQREEVTA